VTREFHILSGGGVLLAGVGLVFAARAEWISPAAAAADDLGPMDSIEASLAYKKATPKQPQKQHREAVHEQVEGVSHDENKAPDPSKKPDPPKRKPDDNAPGPTAKPSDDDAPVGKITDEPVGQFDGSDFGFAEESKGDPYFQALVGDFIKGGGEYPSILAASGAPVECFHLDADGKVVDTKLKEKSEEDALNDWAEHAAKELKDEREQHPQPVPPHLLKAATTRWICLKIKL
jgi:outer membrane biosynthesis protein TonB